MTPFWSYGDLVFLLLLYLPVTSLSISTMQHRPGGLLAGQLIAYVIWFAAVAILFRVRYRKPFWKSLGWIASPRWTVASVASGLALVVGIALAAKFLRLPDIDSPVQKLFNDPKMLPLAVLSISIVGPVAEELAFRGLAQPLLVRSYGAFIGILLTAIPFGLLHAPQLKMAWGNVALIVAAGIAFGFLRLLSGSTLQSALMHATYNTALLAGFLAGKK